MITWLFETKIGRYALLAGILAIAGFAIREHFIHEGKLKEIASNQQQVLKTATANTDADRTALLQSLTAAASALHYASAQIQASQAQQRAIVTQLSQLTQTKASADAGIAKLSDSELHNFITSKLAIRTAADTNAGYEPAEERALASCVTDEPLCEQSRALLQQQSDAQTTQIQAEQSANAALQKEQQSLVNYSQQLETNFVTLRNAFAQPRRSRRCLWLWRCKRDVVPVPSVDQIKNAAAGISTTTQGK